VRAFTLIELLVTIAIIALLLAILLQRQIGVALMTYANTYNEFVPRESGSSEPAPARLPQVPAWRISATQQADYNISWPFNLRPFVDANATASDNAGGLSDRFRSAAVYRCPGRTRDDHNIHYVSNGVRFVRSFSGAPIINELDAKPPMRLSGVAFTSGTLYLTDFADDPGNRRANNYNLTAPHEMHLSIFYDIRRLTNINGGSTGGDPTLWIRTAPNRHGNGANAMFMDGHASQVPAKTLLDPKTWDDLEYK
jgi:prepilin-type N-terminal cleavage/methylation domain-containing protein/prepilin-type processing-associated H-X9-DG protein